MITYRKTIRYRKKKNKTIREKSYQSEYRKIMGLMEGIPTTIF